MNFMRIKKIGKMATTAIIAFIAVVVFINPQKAQASQGGAVTVTATSNYVLDDSHNVDISITAYVEYAYDEGAYGWVINIIPQSWYDGRGRIRSVGQKKCFGDASVWPELLRLRDLN